MGVDVIDLYQIHRPDMYAHPAEVAATLAALRDAGKIREVGVSNHTPAQVAALQAHLPFPIVTNQPEFSARSARPDARRHARSVHASWASPRWRGAPSPAGSLATGDGVRPELLDRTRPSRRA